MPSLQDYLSGADYDEAPAMAEGTSDAARKRLEDLLFSPDTPVPIPNTREGSPGRERARTGLAALSDALHALSEAKGRSRGHPSVLDALQEERTRRALIEAENQKAQRNAETAARRGRAGYELGRLDRKEADKIKAAEEAKAKLDRETFYYQKEAEDLGIEGWQNMPPDVIKDRVTQQKGRDREDLKRHRDLQEKFQSRGLDLETIRTKLQADEEKRKASGAAAKPDPLDTLEGKRQHEAVMKFRAQTIAMKQGFPDLLAKVNGDPNALRSVFMDDLEAARLTPEQEKEVLEFFEAKVAPLIEKAQPKGSVLEGRSFAKGPAPGAESLGVGSQRPPL